MHSIRREQCTSEMPTKEIIKERPTVVGTLVHLPRQDSITLITTVARCDCWVLGNRKRKHNQAERGKK
jgi:hypothetical protein